MNYKYRAQYKVDSQHNSWLSIGTYMSEEEAKRAIIDRKKWQANIVGVQVVDRNGKVVFNQSTTPTNIKKNF